MSPHTARLLITGTTLEIFRQRNVFEGGKGDCGYGDATGGNFTIANGYTGESLKAIAQNADGTATNVKAFFNYDFTSFTNNTNSVQGVCLVNGGNVELACSGALPGASGVIGPIINPWEHQGVLHTELLLTQNIPAHNGLGAIAVNTNGLGFVADVFTFGERVNNAIYRIQVEESGDDTSEFVGTVEFIMLNQLNFDDDATYTGLAPVDVDVIMIVHEDMTDEDSPRINYLDHGADGVSTQIADQQEAPTHSGVVSFDMANYKIADTVVVTLEDQDLNTDAALIDVYITQADDKVGDGDGTAVLDITFDDEQWVDKSAGSCTGHNYR